MVDITVTALRLLPLDFSANVLAADWPTQHSLSLDTSSVSSAKIELSFHSKVYERLHEWHGYKQGTSFSCPVSCSLVWELLSTWWTISQMKLEHPLTVQPQQEVKLSRHGVKFCFSLSVVVVVVGQGMESMWVITEGPEPVQMHVGTVFERQASHDNAGAEPHCP